MNAPDPILSYLCTRNLLMRVLNTDNVPDTEWDALSSETLRLEALIYDTSAITLDGFAAKLMLAVETLLEGATPDPVRVRDLICEGRNTFGIGDFITPALEGTAQ